MSLLPTSYPGHNILTEDLGMISDNKIVNVQNLERLLKYLVELKKSELKDAVTLYNKEEIKYLVGNKDFTSKIKEPFEKNIINFLVFFSQEIEKNKKLRDYPDLKSLSFFVENLICLD